MSSVTKWKITSLALFLSLVASFTFDLPHALGVKGSRANVPTREGEVHLRLSLENLSNIAASNVDFLELTKIKSYQSATEEEQIDMLTSTLEPVFGNAIAQLSTSQQERFYAAMRKISHDLDVERQFTP